MRIFIAEDDRTSRTMLVRLLEKWGHEVLVAEDGEEAWAALQSEDAPRLVILDWMMPGMDGVELCERLRHRARPDDPYTYIILLTAKASQENVVAGMEAGADDYITKPFDGHELRVRIRAGQRIIDLQTELLAAKDELKLQSMTDALTGCCNRRAVLERIEEELSHAERRGASLGLSILDIDFFKKVNDTHGHGGGDEVLRECVRRISATIRKHDVVGRLGGEEFLVIAPDADEATARMVFERVRRAIADEDFEAAGVRFRVTVSQGMVVSSGGALVDGLIADADEALYRAKANGRDRVERAEPPRAPATGSSIPA
jgi:two-component system, cell cycle response regulator